MRLKSVELYFKGKILFKHTYIIR